MEFTLKEQITESKPISGKNESEKEFYKLMQLLDSQKDAKYEHNHFEMTEFATLDNNLIDSVFSSLLTMSPNEQKEDLLSEFELIHYIRNITKELEFVNDLRFVKFWVYIVKFPLFIDFMDQFL